jgi:hypothetical protein
VADPAQINAHAPFSPRSLPINAPVAADGTTMVVRVWSTEQESVDWCASTRSGCDDRRTADEQPDQACLARTRPPGAA